VGFFESAFISGRKGLKKRGFWGGEGRGDTFCSSGSSFRGGVLGGGGRGFQKKKQCWGAEKGFSGGTQGESKLGGANSRGKKGRSFMS